MTFWNTQVELSWIYWSESMFLITYLTYTLEKCCCKMYFTCLCRELISLYCDVMIQTSLRLLTVWAPSEVFRPSGGAKWSSHTNDTSSYIFRLRRLVLVNFIILHNSFVCSWEYQTTKPVILVQYITELTIQRRYKIINYFSVGTPAIRNTVSKGFWAQHLLSICHIA